MNNSAIKSLQKAWDCSEAEARERVEKLKKEGIMIVKGSKLTGLLKQSMIIVHQLRGIEKTFQAELEQLESAFEASDFFAKNIREMIDDQNI